MMTTRCLVLVQHHPRYRNHHHYHYHHPTSSTRILFGTAPHRQRLLLEPSHMLLIQHHYSHHHPQGLTSRRCCCSCCCPSSLRFGSNHQDSQQQQQQRRSLSSSSAAAIPQQQQHGTFATTTTTTPKNEEEIGVDTATSTSSEFRTVVAAADPSIIIKKKKNNNPFLFRSTSNVPTTLHQPSTSSASSSVGSSKSSTLEFLSRQQQQQRDTNNSTGPSSITTTPAVSINQQQVKSSNATVASIAPLFGNQNRSSLPRPNAFTNTTNNIASTTTTTTPGLSLRQPNLWAKQQQQPQQQQQPNNLVHRPQNLAPKVGTFYNPFKNLESSSLGTTSTTTTPTTTTVSTPVSTPSFASVPAAAAAAAAPTSSASVNVADEILAHLDQSTAQRSSSDSNKTLLQGGNHQPDRSQSPSLKSFFAPSRNPTATTTTPTLSFGKRSPTNAFSQSRSPPAFPSLYGTTQIANPTPTTKTAATVVAPPPSLSPSSSLNLVNSLSFGRKSGSQPSSFSFDKSSSSSSSTLSLPFPSNPWSTTNLTNKTSFSSSQLMASSAQRPATLRFPTSSPPPSSTIFPSSSSLNSAARMTGTVAPATDRITPTTASSTFNIFDLRAALVNALDRNKKKREQQQLNRNNVTNNNKIIGNNRGGKNSSFVASSMRASKMERRPTWRNDDEYNRNLGAQHRRRQYLEEMSERRTTDHDDDTSKYRKRRQYLADDNDGEQDRNFEKPTQPKMRKPKGLAPGSVVQLPNQSLGLSDVSQLFQVKVPRVIRVLQSLGESIVESPSSHQFKLDVDLMELVALELGYRPVRPPRRKQQPVDDRETLLQRRAFSEVADQEDIYQSFPSRPPVVCIMGHVDHGKTTLMDSLRRRSRLAAAAAAAAENAKSTTKSKTTSNNKNSSKKKDSTTQGDVAGTEAGGITQAISAFQIALESDPTTAVTFLDTPGHAAFRAMRESGSQAADIMVLVIAADDGVSPQTVEIINFYKSLVKEVGPSGISLVIALNKIDKDGIDVDESRIRIMNQLLEHDIFTEDVKVAPDHAYGPPVQIVPISGLTGQGLEELIESLALQSEIMDLRADVNARAEGLVMEASLDQGMGVVAHSVVRWGTLHPGDVVVSGTCWGKVKVIKNVHDSVLDEALPSTPIQIVGFSSIPKAGDPFVCVASEDMARQLTERRKTMLQNSQVDAAESTARHLKALAAAKEMLKEVIDDDEENEAEDEIRNRVRKRGPQPKQVDVIDENDDSIRVPMLIKADTDAALAAVRESLNALADESSHNLVLDWVSAGVGAITQADVKLAKQAGASIYTFGLGKRKNEIRKIMEMDGVTARDHTIIYELLEDAKTMIAKQLPPVEEDIVHGKARVQALFEVKGNRVAGLKVLDGKLIKDKVTLKQEGTLQCQYRVLRNGHRVSPDDSMVRASSLKHVKDDVTEVKKGDECGLLLDQFDDYQVNDVIECYSIVLKNVFS